MDYMIGCNYWGSKYGIDMWKYWDEESVRKDLKELAKYGVRYLRVFPNWRDFQPIHRLYGIRGQKRDIRFENDAKLDNEFGIDLKQIQHFETFCDIAKENGIKLVVSLITGWMSGRLYCPPALEGKNPITDAESLMWQSRFTKGFCRMLKHRKEIVSWDLGNECNCMGAIDYTAQGYIWTLTIRNSIIAEDNTRPIMSGMHSLNPANTCGSGNWCISDQSELTDILTPHPYPSPSVGGHIDPMNKLRTTLVATTQVEIYSGVGKKPAMMQESGSFNDMYGDASTAADFLRVNILSGWANGSLGYFWWCAHDQLHLKNPPNSWSMVENELGILDNDYNPKKVALTMRKMTDLIEGLPFGKLPKRTEADVVYIIPACHSPYHNCALSAYVMAKQAGLDMTFAYFEQELPEAKMYILPSLSGWAPVNTDIIDVLKERIKNGASLLITTGSGCIAGAEELLGIASSGMSLTSERRAMELNGDKIPFSYSTKLLMRSIGAKVLAEDTDGTVIFSENKYGDGKVFFLNFPLEDFTSNITGCFDEHPYYKIYQTVGADIIKTKPVKSNIPDIAVTIHPVDDNKFIAVAINYSNQTLPCDLEFPKNAETVVCYGDGETISPCDATVFEVTLK